MASRGHLGGLAGTTAEAAAALAACGFGLVLIETVGTGQSEVEVAAIADTTVVVQAPEMGDEVQALKAGLLEVADIVVVNKSDRPGADRAAAELRAVLMASARARCPRRRPTATQAAGGPAGRRPHGAGRDGAAGRAGCTSRGAGRRRRRRALSTPGSRGGPGHRHPRGPHARGPPRAGAASADGSDPAGRGCP